MAKNMKIVIEIDTDNDQDIRTIEELIELLRKNESSSK